MVPPIWLDESGRRCPVYPCPRCGREAPLHRFRREHLRLLGWRLYGEASSVNWCGHAQAFVVLPESRTWCRLVPVLGDAT